MRSPTIEWQVAGACNYDCTYCIQSRAYRKGRPSAEAPARKPSAFSRRCPGVGRSSASGGEAFAHPLFLELAVPALMAETHHRIECLTNLSATEPSCPASWP